MCGIVGVVSKSYNGFTVRDKDIFHELLFIDTLRGNDATGVMAIDRDGNLDLAKEATEASYYQAAPEYQKLLTGAVRDGAALIGHNRKATRGAVSDDNAHPFVVDDRIVLLHNGTMYGDHKKIADVEVDSHAIAHLIHRHNDDVAEALRELNAAYALVWYDVQNRSLNFIRNSQRPLYFVESSGAWYFASEIGMLGWILGRNAVSITGKYELLPEGELHTFTRKGQQWDRKVTVLDLEKKTTTGNGLPWGTSSNDEDHCVLPSDHVSRNRYHDIDDDDDVIFGGSIYQRAHGTPALLTPVTKPLTQVSYPRPAPSAVKTLENYVVKVLPGESARAMKAGCTMSVDRFQKIAMDYQSGNWVTGEVFDYDYVKGDTATQGIFLYAYGLEDPDLMIRGYVPFDPTNEKFEEETLYLAMENKKCAFLIKTKGWHKHESGPVEDGFSVLYANEVKPITPITVINKEQIDA